MNWHDELYKLHKQGNTWGTDKHRRGFRFKTKKQLLYVVAGGTSIYTVISNNHFREVTKDNTDYIQISKFWYEKHSRTFNQCLTYSDEIKLKQKENTTTLDFFVKEQLEVK